MLSLYNDEKPFKFHIELTDGCNARCPQCPRNLILQSKKLVEHPNLAGKNITFEQYKKIFQNYQRKAATVVFSGNFGDPVFNPDFADILKYTIDNVVNKYDIRSHVKTCTNGGFRSPSWWADLAKATKTKRRNGNVMCFAIDGLEDTHHLYRVNTRFDRVIANAKAWIDAGGTAEWQWIRFDHNKHQEADARQLAKDLGFTIFQTVNTSRGSIDHFEFNGDKYFLKAPTESNLDEFDITPEQKQTIKKISKNRDVYVKNIVEKKVVEKTVINCVELDLNRVYIDCEGYVYPCCWIGSHQYHKRNQTRTLFDVGDILKTRDYTEDDKVWNRDFIDILHDAWFEYELPNSWDKSPCSICEQHCGEKQFRTAREYEVVR